MPVYLIIDIHPTDQELYSQYVAKVPEVIAKYGGRYLVRGGKATPFIGDWQPERIIVVEFDTLERLQRCFDSQEYLELAPLREQATLARAIVVEGCGSGGR